MCARFVLLAQKVKESDREQRLVIRSRSLENESFRVLIKRDSQELWKILHPSGLNVLIGITRLMDFVTLVFRHFVR